MTEAQIATRHIGVLLWKAFGKVPVDEWEHIEEDFLHFPKYTHREHVWHWFESAFGLSVGYLTTHPLAVKTPSDSIPIPAGTDIAINVYFNVFDPEDDDCNTDMCFNIEALSSAIDLFNKYSKESGTAELWGTVENAIGTVVLYDECLLSTRKDDAK